MTSKLDIGHVLRAALPVMLGYLAIGIPCGIMWGKMGVDPLGCFLVSATFYSGAGQFMIAPLVLAGTPVLSIVVSVSLVSARQMLYSSALAPYTEGASRPLTLAFAATVTDESFGVNVERFESGEGWGVSQGLALNCLCMLSWATSNALGSAVGPAISLPTDIITFAMTSIFICLLLSQPMTRTNVAVAAVTAAGVVVAKLAGAGGAAIVLGAVAGVVVGVLLGGGEEGTGGAAGAEGAGGAAGADEALEEGAGGSACDPVAQPAGTVPGGRGEAAAGVGESDARGDDMRGDDAGEGGAA